MNLWGRYNYDNNTPEYRQMAGAKFRLMADLDFSGSAEVYETVYPNCSEFNFNYHVIHNYPVKSPTDAWDKTVFLIPYSGIFKNLYLTGINYNHGTDARTYAPFRAFPSASVILEQVFHYSPVFRGTYAFSGLGAMEGDGSAFHIRSCMVDLDYFAGDYPWTSGIGNLRNNTSSISDTFCRIAQSSSRDLLAGIGTYPGHASGNNGIKRCISLGNLTADTGTCDQSVGGIAASTITGMNANNVVDCVCAMDSIYNRRGAAYAMRISRTGGTNNYANAAMTVNGSTVTSSDASSNHGRDASLSDFKDAGFYTANLPNWDFSTKWKFSNPNGRYKGFPIPKWVDETKLAQWGIA
jgi:hypothetical protein